MGLYRSLINLEKLIRFFSTQYLKSSQNTKFQLFFRCYSWNSRCPVPQKWPWLQEKSSRTIFFPPNSTIPFLPKGTLAASAFQGTTRRCSDLGNVGWKGDVPKPQHTESSIQILNFGFSGELHPSYSWPNKWTIFINALIFFYIFFSPINPRLRLHYWLLPWKKRINDGRNLAAGLGCKKFYCILNPEPPDSWNGGIHPRTGYCFPGMLKLIKLFLYYSKWVLESLEGGVGCFCDAINSDTC